MLAVLREALSNISRHAAASSTSVEVAADAISVELVVTDDGKGLPEDGRRSGLANLARRASDLGGSFSAEGTPGSGTTVRWCVPLGD
jgi:signal transduction histidine kinase